jgi:Skp family chaperone for outer membrane proteins
MRSRHFSFRLLHAVVVAGVFCFAAPAFAEESLANVPLKILVVDIPNVLSRSKAAQDIQKQLEEQRRSYQSQIASQEEKLRSAQVELDRQRGVLSADAFEKKQKEFRDQIASVQKGVQEKKGTLEGVFNQSMGELRKAVVTVVAEIAKERKATLVLANQQVVLVEKTLDITDEVLEKLNKSNPSGSIKVSEQPKKTK